MTEIFRPRDGRESGPPKKCNVREDHGGVYAGDYGGALLGRIEDGQEMEIVKTGNKVLHRCDGEKATKVRVQVGFKKYELVAKY